MIVMICSLRVKTGCGPELERHVAELAAAMAEHAGVLGFNLNRSTEDPAAYTLIEKYADEGALYYHSTCEAGKRFAARANELVDGGVSCVRCDEVVDIGIYK